MVEKLTHTLFKLPRSSVRIFAVFFLLFGLQAVSWTLGTPLLGAADEPAHIMTAAANAHGQLIKAPNEGPRSPQAKVKIAYTFIATPAESTCYSLPAVPDACNQTSPQCHLDTDNGKPCGRRLVGGNQLIASATYTGHYPPFYYFVTGAPTLVSSRPNIIYVMRFMSILLGVLFIAIAFYATYRWAPTPLLVAGASLGLTPVVMSLIGIVNPSGFEISTALCFWTTGVLIVKGKFKPIPRSLLLFFFVSGVGLLLSRSDGPLWFFIALVILGILVNRATARQLMQQVRLRGYMVIGWLATLVVALVWIFAEHASTLLPNVPYPANDSMFFIVKSVLGSMYVYGTQMVALLGWNNIPAPLVTVFLWCIGAGCLLVLSLSAVTKRSYKDLLALLGIIAAVVLLPVVYTLIYAHRYGNIFQGRYILPGAVGIPVVVALLAHGAARNPLSLTRALLVLVALGNITTYAWSLLKYTVGDGGHWIPPVPAPLLIGIFILINLATVTWLWAIAGKVQQQNQRAA